MKAFVDTNVFVYAALGSDKSKAQVARELIAGLAARGQLVVSTQVLQELYAVLVKRQGVRPASALAVVEQLARQPVQSATADLVVRALQLSGTRQLSPWDALIVQAALDAGCDTLYTEDLQDGQRIQGLAIVNPFISPPKVHEPAPAYSARSRKSA
jgi:predicted nucleic acid-binding protein